MKQAMRLGRAVVLMAALAVGMASAGQYGYKAAITFSGYNQSETLTNFPALVVLSNNCFSGFAYSQFQSGSNDLAFTADAAGMQNLNYEIDTWNTNGASYVWVQVPVLTNNATITAWWGATGQTLPICTTNGSTWSNGYVGVYHFSETNGTTVKNSSTYGSALNGTISGPYPVQLNATGWVGTAANWIGDSHSGGMLTIPDNAYLRGPSNITISHWGYFRGPGLDGPGYGRVYVKSDGNPYGLLSRNNADLSVEINGTVSTGDFLRVDYVWQYGVWAYDSATSKTNIFYRNGVSVYGVSATANLAQDSGALIIGNRSTGDRTLAGVLDEFRVSKVTRSANWVWAEYLNMASNGVFNTYGAMQAKAQISDGVSQNLSANSADVVGTLLTNGSSAATVYLFCATNDCTINAANWTAIGTVTNVGTFTSGAVFTNTLSGLSSNTTYYWNLMASNSAGVAWGAAAGSPSFTTYSAPAVNNGNGAAAVGVFSATLSGNLTAGGSANVYILLGTADGVWTSTNVVGTVSGTPKAFSIPVGGLAKSTTYYYRCFASNACGTAWAAGSTNFTTLSGLYANWSGNASIQFGGYTRTETLTNFPALVVLSNNCFSGFAYSQFLSGSNDLAFTDATGMSNLNYEIEAWNTNGVSYVWLQVPALTSNTVITAWWGASGQVVQPCTTNGSTWDANYRGVWHMTQTNALDSTTNNNAGTASGGVTLTTGVNGIGCCRFDGVAGKITVPDKANLDFTDAALTIEAWVRLPVLPGTEKAIVRKDNHLAMEFLDSTDIRDLVATSGTTGWAAGKDRAYTFATNAWYYRSFIYNGANYHHDVNGDVGAAQTVTGSVVPSSNPMYFSVCVNGSTFTYLQADIGEIRLSRVARSTNWTWACYQNMASNGVFQSGVVSGNGNGLPIVANGAAQNIQTTAADLTGTLITNGSSSATVYVCCATNDCTTNAANWASNGIVTNVGKFANGATFTNTVSNLRSNTVYYWNLMASNTIGVAWAATAGSPWFKTYGLPAVSNAGATGIGPYAATLNGVLTSGAGAHVFFVWGTNSGSLSNTLDAGVASEGAFSAVLSGLNRNTTYYYSALASNIAGSAQAATPTNFTTLPYVWITGSASLSEGQTNLYLGNPVVVDGSGAVLTLSNSATYGQLPVYQFGNLIVTNGASVVGLSQGSMSPYTITNAGVAIQVAGDLIVAGGSALNADYTGFGWQTGPGAASGNYVGGTHGGLGMQNTKPTYGSAQTPTTLGSGGGGSSGNVANPGVGGGSIKLIVGGNLVVNGRLSANGGDGRFGGSAGGSIWITGGCTLGGTGEVQVSGGVAEGINQGGGGGRLSIDDTVTCIYSGNIRGARGAQQSVSDAYPPGDVYHGCGAAGSVYIGASARQNFTVYPNTFVVLGNDIANVFSNLTVYGTLIPAGSYLGQGTAAVICATNITIAAGGKITADGWGFAAQTGPGAGTSTVGANHGGRGGSNTNGLYGSVSQPVNMGSGSGGGAGGGAITLIVSGNLTINGNLSANGSIGHNQSSGAGGSIWITGGGTVNGTGNMQAYGYSSGASYGSGGGGRISVDDTMTYAFTGNIRAGTTTYDCSPGTLYLPASARASFLIDTNQTFIVGNGATYSFGALTVKGTLDCGADPYAAPGGTGIVITANNLTIADAGAIKADFRGFYGNNASAAWASGPGMGGSNTGATHAGAGYANTNATYGSATQPTTLGSGGYGAWNLEASPDFGGGAIKLVVSNALTVNGTLSANGGIAAGYGGSAGGSLWIDVGTLAGSGRIQANGGVGTYGGGGGRIAVNCHRKGSFSGLPANGIYANADTNVSATITVQGGNNVGASGAEDGTIYVNTVPSGTAIFIQ